MKKEEIQDILACLSNYRAKFYYFRGRYALILLSYAVGKGRGIHEIKSSRFCQLLHKPLARKITRTLGEGFLTPEAIGAVWPSRYHCYLLTLGCWGGREPWARFYNQTSRPGWNLVLHLNFSSRHNQAYNALLKPDAAGPFKCDAHPIAEGKDHTLAWARLDLDMDSGEALIEEIQTDWIRMALESRKVLEAYEKNPHANRLYRRHRYIDTLGCDSKALARYLDYILKPHVRLWDEAMLASAIWFLREEIGMLKIFYHAFDFGCRIKRISGYKPPRSLYTKLPERFCFQKTSQPPDFLLRKNNRKMIHLLKSRDQTFYLLDFTRNMI